jgi:Tol biopolymer transport system component
VAETNFQSERTPVSSALPPPLTPEGVREQLSVLLQHPSFVDSERSRQLMAYLVERALRGDAADLKEYVLAADVFGRGTDFDPKLDSVVRAQVSRLRAKLADYYQGDGRHDPVRFDLSRRGYALQLKPGSPTTLVAIAPTGPSSQTAHQPRLRYWTAGLAAAVVAAAMVVGLLHRTPQPVPTLSLTRMTPEDPPILHPSISRDGKLLSYSVLHDNGAMDLYVQQMAGGQPLKILGPRFNFLQSLSPDGSRVVFSSFENGGGTYVVPALGGMPKRVAPLGHLPSVSPDGKWVLYSRYPPDHRRIYVVSSDGGEPRQLHPEFDTAQWAMWAPDGDTYFFFGHRGPGEDLDYWVASLDGSRLVSIGLRSKFLSLGLAKADSWVAIMQWVNEYLYVEVNDGDVQKLWRIRIDPRTWTLIGAPQQLASFLARQPQPAIAGNGRFVVVDLLVRYSEWILPLDSESGRVTGAARQVTGDVGEQSPEFLSGDGSHIVYGTRGGGETRFWLKDLSSGAESIIQTTPAPRSIRALSYDAKRLYYETGAGIQTVAYRATLPEGTSEKLCGQCCVLAISSDEKTMLSCAQPQSGGVVLRHLDAGGSVTELLPPGFRGSYMFSPDGRWLAFHETTDYYQSRVVIVPVKNDPVPSKDWIVIAEGPGANRGPAWSPQGNLLYFRSNREGPESVWAQRLDARNKRPLGQPFKVYHDDAGQWVPWDLGNLAVAADKMLLRHNKPTSGLWTGQLP